MVPVRRATSWRAVTSLLLLSVGAAVRVLLVTVSVATDAQLLDGGGGQIGNDVDSLLLIDIVGGVLVDMIGGVVSGTRSGGLQLAQFLMGCEKKVLIWVQVLSSGSCRFHSLQSSLKIPVWKIN